jgi:multiple sugar transport system permease protein
LLAGGSRVETSLHGLVRGARLLPLCLPWLIGFIVFTAGPIVASLVLSFHRSDAFNAPSFVGLDNYAALILRDRLFFHSLRVTAVYALFAVPLGIVGALTLALMLNQRIPGLSVWRTIYYLPSVVSGVALAMLWSWIFNPEPPRVS